MDRSKLAECEGYLGYRFARLERLEQALTHASTKTPDHPSNERLEFLGDSVLGLVISHYLYALFPDHPEGQLTKIKSVVVSTPTLARASRACRLDHFMSVGKGVTATRVLPDSLLADVFEAVVAALYIDGGLEEARAFVLRHLESEIARVVRNRHAKNYKSLLQHLTQRTFAETPRYRVVAEQGPDHHKKFRVMAQVGDREFGPGLGNSKKEAEQRAARKALLDLCRESRPAESASGV
ncbi:MAG: ribonuclease III [Planctomycetes bacterium]|nr:ribonuclease III [Planctomycetota bacterium]